MSDRPTVFLRRLSRTPVWSYRTTDSPREVEGHTYWNSASEPIAGDHILITFFREAASGPDIAIGSSLYLFIKDTIPPGNLVLQQLSSTFY